MNLPPHGARICVGVDLHGVQETCDEPVELGSMFPYCTRHRLWLTTQPRKGSCAGATVYDAVMRPSRLPCQNSTGSQKVRLCPSCAVIEVREKEKAQQAFREKCPTCGRSGPRPQVHHQTRTPISSASGQPGTRTYPRSYQPHSTRQQQPFRPPSNPQGFQWGVPPRYEPSEEDD